MQWLVTAADWWRRRVHPSTADRDANRLGLHDDGRQRLHNGYEDNLPSIRSALIEMALAVVFILGVIGLVVFAWLSR